MKVILVNGSPHKEGCTYTALKEVEKELIAAGVETELIWLGTQPVSGCLGCNGCCRRGPDGEKPTARCVINDVVNEFLDKAEQTDGFIFGSLGIVFTCFCTSAQTGKKYQSCKK